MNKKSKLILIACAFLLSVVALLNINYSTNMLATSTQITQWADTLTTSTGLTVSVKINEDKSVANGGYVMLDIENGEYIDFSIDSNDLSLSILYNDENLDLETSGAVVDGDGNVKLTLSKDNIENLVYASNTGKEGEQISTIAGKWEFQFRLPNYSTTYSYSFYILDISKYNKESQIPTLSKYSNESQIPTLSKIDNSNISYVYTSNQERLALSFDAEKYILQGTILYNGKTTSFNTSFKYLDDKNEEVQNITNKGILTFTYDNSDLEPVKFVVERNASNFMIFNEASYNFSGENTTNYFKPLFFNLGEYELTWNYTLFNGGEFKYDESSNGTLVTGNTIPGKISIYGSQIYYAKDFTSKADLVNFTSEEFALTTGSVEELPYNSFISTNQAPIWFETNGTISGTYSYSVNGINWADKNYYKGIQVTEAGYYIFKLIIDDLSTSEKEVYQQFAFAITNNTPLIECVSKNEEGNYKNSLLSGGYSKYSTIVSIPQVGTFDYNVRAYYKVATNFDGNYSEEKEFTPAFTKKNSFVNNGEFTEFNQDGNYQIKIYFTKNSYVTTSFNIDTQNLDEYIVVQPLQAYTTSSQTNTLTYIKKGDPLNLSQITTNSPFTVYAKTKKSGAPVTGSIVYYDLQYSKNTKQTELYTDKSNTCTYILSDYVAKNASNPVNYDFVNYSSNELGFVDSKYVFSTQRIYIFTFTDVIGNEFTRVIFYDASKPNVLLSVGEDDNKTSSIAGLNNVVSNVTNVIWGKYKGIKFPQDYADKTNISVREKLLNVYDENINKTTKFIGNTNEMVMLVQLNDVTATSLPLNQDDNLSVLLNEKYTPINEEQDLTVYPATNKYQDIQDKYKGEKIYKFVVSDVAGNKTTINVEMNMDKSKGAMKAVNKEIWSSDDNNESKFNTLNSLPKMNLSDATNYDWLVFTWVDVNDENSPYKIGSVTAEFYPLTYDKASSNYPYSANAYEFSTNSTKLDLLTNATKITDGKGSTKSYCFSSLINLEDSVTKVGKYVITRTYANEENFNTLDEGDTFTRTYVYYVDRNPIISVPDFTSENPTKEVGDSIHLNLGEQTYNINFDEFYRDSIKNITVYENNGGSYIPENLYVSLVTNVVPINIKVPYSKYSYISSDGKLQNISLPNTFNLTVTVSYYKNGLLNSKTTYTKFEDGWTNILLSDAGIYKITIHDNVNGYFGSPIDQITPYNDHSNYFAFQINHSEPEVDVYTAKEKSYAYNQNDGNLTIELDTNSNSDTYGSYRYSYENINGTPLTLSIDGKGNYVYSLSQDDTNKIESLTVSRRTRSNNSWSSYVDEINKTFENNKLLLPAYSDNSNFITEVQYKINFNYNGTSYELYTPSISDFSAPNFAKLNLVNGVSSTKANIIAIGISEPTSIYNAKIDINNIIIDRFEKLSGAYKYDKKLALTTDYTIEARIKTTSTYYYNYYTILIYNSDVNKEYNYKITYNYLGDEKYFGNYYSKTINVVIDRSAPIYNLEQISKSNDEYRSNFNIAAPYKSSSYYQENDKFSYYANTGLFDFAISSDYEFKLPSVSNAILSQNQEGSQIYYRHYYKYKEDYYNDNNKNKAYQAIVPGDEVYINNSNALKFNASDGLWTEFYYNNGPFSKVVGNLDGYYEIVEIDEAGNHTIYTVILCSKSPELTFSVNKLDEATNDVITSQVIITSNDESIDSINNLTLNSIYSIDDWYEFTIDSKKYTITPQNSINNYINEINDLFKPGNIYSIEMTSRFGYKINLKASVGKKDTQLGVKSKMKTANGWDLEFELEKDATKAKSIQILWYDSEYKDYQIIEDDLLNKNSNGVIKGLKEGLYKFIITDNFRTYEIKEYLGDDSEYTLNYYGEKFLKDGVTYTAYPVEFKASKHVYDVIITKDKNQVNLTEQNDFISYNLTAANTLNTFDEQSGGKVEYEITIINKLVESQKTLKIIVYNIFPSISVSDELGNSMADILATERNKIKYSTSKTLTFSYNINQAEFNYNVTLYKVEETEKIINDNVTLGYKVSEPGIYRLTFTIKELNISRSAWFRINDDNSSMYTVRPRNSETINQGDELLNISNCKEDIQNSFKAIFGNSISMPNYPEIDGNLMVKNYFVQYNSINQNLPFIIEINTDKGLRTNFGSEYVPSFENIITVGNNVYTIKTYIYFIYGNELYNYFEIIAVTTVPTTNAFAPKIRYFNGNEYITLSVTADNATYRANIYNANTFIELLNNDETTQNYFGEEHNNKIYAHYYYSANNDYTNNKNWQNNQPDGKIDLTQTNINLTVSGYYRFKFIDSAGNILKFGNNNQNNYFELLLQDKVLATVNSERPIYGAVYNGEVKLNIPDFNKYKDLEIQIFHNGKPLSMELNYEYSFSEQGVYNVKIKGKINSNELEENNILFSIINSDEAKLAYEFVNINGFEISKVEKNGTDIIDSLASKSTLFISAFNDSLFNSGSYIITVNSVNSNALIPAQSFTFKVWINSNNPVILSSIDPGQSTTKNISITFNGRAIYKDIGSSKVCVKNEFGQNVQTVEINSELGEGNQELQIENTGVYYVVLETESGNIVRMFKVTKNEPLNFISILIIVIAVIVAAIGTYIFVRFRLNMKIK